MNPNTLPGRRLRYLTPPDGTGEGNPGAGTGAAAAAGAAAGAAAAGGDQVVTLTQAALTALTTKEKDQGRRAALAQMAADLGFTDAAAVRAFVEAARAKETAALSDVEREKQEAQRARQDAERDKAEATKERHALQRERALLRLGVNDDDLTDALALLSVQVPFADADEAAVTTGATELAARRPELFTPRAGVPRPPAPSGAPTTRPPASGQPNQQAPGARGKSEAARRFGDRARTNA